MAAISLPATKMRAPPGETVEGLRIRITGTVQGVGLRPWVYRIARGSGVTGSVRNDEGGVTIDAFGAAPAIAEFADHLRRPPPAALFEHVALSVIAPRPTDGFEIVRSDRGTGRHVSIPPDLAVCDECRAEILDPADRRYRYAFTNCTNCGPRFTIANDVPYDRVTTTMARFGMCPSCLREYRDVDDRRFHAQPNTCSICGPRLELRAPGGTHLDAKNPIGVVAQAIADGLIVAIKGLGGFHLACDATSAPAIERLRQRKRRDEKPFAVMVRDLDQATQCAVVSAAASTALTSMERPIVLLPRRGDSLLADGLAPGNHMVGLMLPYSPLHHLLLADAGRPLVMTSGNLSDEPIIIGNEDALQRLGAVADLFLVHDRDIASRCDDSVVAMIDGHATVLRRSRGYVPRSIHVAAGFARPVLACGALLNNTFCLAAGTDAWLGPHIGDLEHLTAFNAYTGAIGRMERFLGIRPEIIACDMHPDYLSTQYAEHRPETVKVAVQHHHAHIVSAMAEHAIDGPAIGIAYDGGGYGTDGTLWGGEVLIATRASFERAATFRPLALAGGTRAIQAPWRLALALVEDAHGGMLPREIRELFADVPGEEFERVSELLRSGIRLPLARGVGRYFEAFGALFLGRRTAGFDGQMAMAWNQVATVHDSRSYAFNVDTSRPCAEIDLRPAVREALEDHASGVTTGAIAAAFHNTIAEATAAVVRFVIADAGPLPIVASGGCFQNARLAETLHAALAPAHDVLFHRTVPPGDGGIALGQAIIADAISRGEA